MTVVNLCTLATCVSLGESLAESTGSALLIDHRSLDHLDHQAHYTVDLFIMHNSPSATAVQTGGTLFQHLATPPMVQAGTNWHQGTCGA